VNEAGKHIEPAKIHQLPGRSFDDTFTDLSLRFQEAQCQRIAEIVLERLEPLFTNATRQAIQFEERLVHPDKFYTADFLAERWFPDKPTKQARNAVYRIPDAELPRHRLGAGKGRVMFYGKEIRAYEQTSTK